MLNFRGRNVEGLYRDPYILSSTLTCPWHQWMCNEALFDHNASAKLALHFIVLRQLPSPKPIDMLHLRSTYSINPALLPPPTPHPLSSLVIFHQVLAFDVLLITRR
nr:hypothetical protein HmN_000286000 [Hymenolepis microstoma]